MIDRATIEHIGTEVATRTWKHILAPVFAHATRDGLKPWEALLHAHETKDRSWRGTDIRIVKEGPTQARYEWAGQPCAAIPYFVISFGGFMRALVNLFARRAYYDVVSECCSSTTVTIRLSWIEVSDKHRSSAPRSLSPAPGTPKSDVGPSDARWSVGARGRA
jgi:hypothetical protein